MNPPHPEGDDAAGGRFAAAQRRERDRILAGISSVKGLLHLLMKRRNGELWAVAERRELREQLRALARLSPYLLVLALPGSVLLLPLLAWWLDRRQMRRENGIEEKSAS